MRGRRRTHRTLAPPAAAGSCLCLCLAFAGPARGGDLDALLFAGADAGAATFASAGAKLTAGPLDHEGFALLATLGGGRRDERGDGRTATRYTGSAAAVFGYQWFFDWGVVAAFAGPELEAEALTGPRPAPPARLGLRLHGEVWARPTEASLVQATAILGTARDGAWARLAWGYRLLGPFLGESPGGAYLGPEASLYADATGYRKWNLGVHATDFALARVALRVSAGVQTETGARRASPYVALAAWTPW